MTPPVPLNTNTAVYPATQPIPNGNTFLGAMPYLGTLYWLVAEITSDVSPTNFALYRSTDGLIGNSRVRVSTGPLFGEGYTQPVVVGGKVYVGYLDYADPGGATGTFKVVGVTLDGVGAWDTPNSTAHTVTLSRVTSTFFHVRPNGDFVITWDEYNAGFTASAVYSLVYAGSWSSRVTISTTTFAAIMQQSTISVANATGLLWAETDSSQSLISLRFSILTATTVTSSTTALADASKIRGETWFPMEPSIYDSGSDTVAFPMVQIIGHPTIPEVDLLIGATSATPTWSVVQVWVGTHVDEPDMPQIVATDTGFTSMWINHNVPDDIIQQSDATTLPGTWSVPTTFWDEGADPIGPPVVLALGLFSISVAFIDHQLAVSVGPYATVEAHTWCGVQYFFPLKSTPPPPPTPTVPCDNVTPQPTTDTQFKLIKVLATMGPVKRLPTRGSVQ